MGARISESIERRTGALRLTGAWIRPMAAADVDEVARIEAGAFSTPWAATTFASLLARSGLVLLVAEAPEALVAGYAVLWCFADEGELANIAVDPAIRGRGLGTLLLDAVLDRARARGVRQLYLEVRESNHQAEGMYLRRGRSPGGCPGDDEATVTAFQRWALER